MNRKTAAGDASVRLLCATFGLSRAAYYAEARRQRGEALRGDTGKVLALPRRPRHIATEFVLAPSHRRACLDRGEDRPHQALNWQMQSERRAERLTAPVAMAGVIRSSHARTTRFPCARVSSLSGYTTVLP